MWERTQTENRAFTVSRLDKYISFIFQLWKDEYLVWDPHEYGDIAVVRLDPALIWVPDIMLYNT